MSNSSNSGTDKIIVAAIITAIVTIIVTILTIRYGGEAAAVRESIKATATAEGINRLTQVPQLDILTSESGQIENTTIPTIGSVMNNSAPLIESTTTLMPPSPSTSVLQVGNVRVVMRGSVEAEQVFVPAGSFMMGSNDGLTDEQPVHKVILDAFWVDRTEVTNAQYFACVVDGICDRPTNINSKTRQNYLIDPDYADYPVIYVDWNDANTFCQWAGGSLPTEAEWEYVARGPDNRKYPWGDTPLPTCDRLNFSPTPICVKDTSKTGEYAEGGSWVGAFDMAGNVWEWVRDRYSDSYYKDSPLQNPEGPDNSAYRVMRGAAWTTAEPFQTRASYRNFLNYPTYSAPDVGFRCSQK